jgi:hypothetical protein
MALTGLMTPSTGQVKVIPYEYEGADYLSGPHSDALRVFPSKGDPITIALPFYIREATFGPDGKSIYGIIADRKSTVVPDRLGISKVDFNPIRANLIPGTRGFVIHSFAISPRQNKIAISGNLQTADGRRCGVFEILIPEGNVRQVLNGDCHDQWFWDYLSLSPSGEQAIASHDRHLELLSLVQGTTRSLGNEFEAGIWSPDGKWIAARESGNRDRLWLIDAANFASRRSLGGGVVLMPQWSPDSRYLLLWKDYIFRCGFYLDVDPPSTLEILDIRSGKRTTIRSSRCQIGNGPTGWISDEISK